MSCMFNVSGFCRIYEEYLLEGDCDRCCDYMQGSEDDYNDVIYGYETLDY